MRRPGESIVDAAWEVARERGLAEITLREIADRIGMRAPSLYTHVASKNAIYDAMFGEAWTQYADEVSRVEADLPQDLAGTLRAYADHFVGFATREPVKHLLMNQRTIPGFEPSADSYAPAVAVMTSSPSTWPPAASRRRRTSTSSSPWSEASRTPSSQTSPAGTAGPASSPGRSTCSSATSKTGTADDHHRKPCHQEGTATAPARP